MSDRTAKRIQLASTGLVLAAAAFVYGLVVERYEICEREDTLPMAVSLDCRLKRDVAKDQPITYSMVELPKDRLVDRLRVEQKQRWQNAVKAA